MKKKTTALVLILAILLCACGAKTPMPEDFYPEIVEIDYTDAVQDCEFILANGAFFGMDYDMVKSLCANDVCEFTYDDPAVGGFLKDGVFYGFYADDEGVLRLRSLNIQDAQEYYGDYGIVNQSIIRGIKLGDTMQSVFEKIPAVDTTLRKAQWQYVYGSKEEGEWAALEFVADSYYAMQIGTSGGYRAHFTFSRTKKQLLWVEIYDESPGSVFGAENI